MAQVYLLEDNPHPEWEGGLLFRAFPDDWALGVAGAAVAGFGGAPTVHGRSPSRPLLEAIDQVAPTWGCSLCYIRSQPAWHRVTASVTWGDSLCYMA